MRELVVFTVAGLGPVALGALLVWVFRLRGRRAATVFWALGALAAAVALVSFVLARTAQDMSGLAWLVLGMFGVIAAVLTGTVGLVVWALGTRSGTRAGGDGTHEGVDGTHPTG